MELFKLRKIGRLSQNLQIVLLIVAYFALVATTFWFGKSEPFPSIFAAFYEEIIFRGFILGGLLSIYKKRSAILLSSFLFGIWHLKNFPLYSYTASIYQVLYAGLFLGPLFAWLTIRTKSIWPGVLVHAVNNILSPLSWWIMGLIGYKSLF